MALVEHRSLSYSALLHLLLVLVAFVGLPVLLPPRPDPAPLVMSVELLPISEVSNVKPSDQPIQKEQHAQAVKTPKPVEPTAKEPPKAPAPQPKPVEKTPPPVPVEEKHFDPMEGAAPKPADKPKPVEPPKDEAKPKETAKPKADDFAALLSKLKEENKTEPSKTAKDAANTTENKTKSDAPYDASQPLSISERDAIRSQFIPCWRAPAGAKDAASLAVRVRVELLQDGTVQTATLVVDQLARYASDPFFRAAADSALRAVHKCSPLKNLPPEKYGTWGTMEINFDPKDML